MSNRMMVLAVALALAGGVARAQQDAGPMVRAVLDTASPVVKRCYDGALKASPGLEGRLVVALGIDAAGNVKDASVKEDLLASTAVTSCVLREVRTLRFPKGAAGLEVAFPFVFASRARTLAVLPFENLTGDPGQDWMRAGMAESLLVKLGQVRTIVLVDRLRLQEVLKEQALAQSGAIDTQGAARAGELAGAQLLVVGNVQKAGEAVRVNARVVDANTSQVRASVAVTGKLADIFTLQDDLAEKLAGAMNIAMDAEARKAMQLRLAGSQQELELLGRAATALADGHHEKARVQYRELVAMNPDLPDAHLGLARSMMMDPGEQRRAMMPEARKELEIALKLRPDDHEAITWLGLVAFHIDEPEVAMEMQRRALRLKPMHPLGQYGLGVACSAKSGMEQEALQALQRAVELDPSNGEFRTQLALTKSVLAGDHKAALEMSGAVMKTDDAGPWNSAVHAGIQFRAGDLRGCVATAADARKRIPEARWGRFKGYMVFVEAACLAKDKRTRDAQAVVGALPAADRAALKKELPPSMKRNAMTMKEMEGYRAVLLPLL